jgi:hypothetical protein
MALEPVACQPRHFVQRSWFFEQMRRTRPDHQLLFAAHLRERMPVKFNDLAIFFADYQQGWSPNAHQRHIVSKVGTPDAR